MTTILAAYDAAPLPPPPPAPLALYLVEDETPAEITGVDDFDLTVENPANERADQPTLDLILDYDPANPQHQALYEACGCGAIVTLRVALRDSAGTALSCREMHCKVMRHRLSAMERMRDDTKWLRVNFDLEVVGEIYHIN